MKQLPSNVTVYKQTSKFTKDTCPGALLKRHNTKVGTWGMIHVEQGIVRYTIFGQKDEVIDLTPGHPGTICLCVVRCLALTWRRSH
mmetsp:Transcript_125612/g.187561  ORF Transcript_125612/g.187561 Transcript_125612/m.187561 type:complete len:86 (+) Transcript_125612:2-259(+)